MYLDTVFVLDKQGGVFCRVKQGKEGKSMQRIKKDIVIRPHPSQHCFSKGQCTVGLYHKWEKEEADAIAAGLPSPKK